KDWQKLQQVIEDLKATQVCPTNNFNEVAAKCLDGWLVQPESVSGDSNGITYSLTIPPNPKNPWAKDKKLVVLEPGRNYGLCLITNDSAPEGIESKCQTFSVYRPFLDFPRVASATGTNYTDPDPFVLIPNAENKKAE